MKKVYLIIDSRFQKTASGFIEEYEKINGKLEGIICIRPYQRNIFYFFRRFPSFLFRILKKIRNKFITLFTKIEALQTIQELKNRWVIRNENSWDLLEKSIDIFQYAHTKAIPLHFITSLSPVKLKKIYNNTPSLFVVYSGGILSNMVLNLPHCEFLNAHMGDMPRYRGMNVLEWALLEGGKPKVSVMILNTKIDDGNVIYKMDIDINEETTIAQLRKKGYQYCYKAMANGALHYAMGKTSPEKQNREGARYYYRMHDKIRHLLSAKLPIEDC